MKFSLFQQTVAKGEIKPLYVLTGKETFLKEETLRIIKRHLGEEDVFFKEYDGENIEINAFVVDIYSQPLFEKWNLLIIKNADKITNDLYDALVVYLKSSLSTSIIVIDIEKFDQRTRFSKLMLEKAIIVECDPIRDNFYSSGELIEWIVSRARHYQKKIAPDAAHLLNELIGNDLNDINLQLEKLSIFLEKRSVIEVDDVQSLVDDKHRINIFDFIDAIFDLQTDKALYSLSQLFLKGSISQDDQVVLNPTHISLQCIRLIHYRLKQLWKFVVTHDSNGILPFLRKKLSKQAASFSRQRLQKIWKKLLESEFHLKSSAMEPCIVLEQLIFFITNYSAQDKIS